MSRNRVLGRLRAFMDDNFLYMRPDFELRNDASLLGSGIIDSMGVMELIGFLEAEFGIVVADTDVTEDNIGTLDAITAYVMVRQPAEHSQTA